MSFGRSKHDLFIHKNFYDLISKFLNAKFLKHKCMQRRVMHTFMLYIKHKRNWNNQLNKFLSHAPRHYNAVAT